jgi:acetylornithine/succinyldiaminopimelate/putrescine aminotransferase
MDVIQKLKAMRDFSGQAETVGLDDAVISRFAVSHPALVDAVNDAYQVFLELSQQQPALMRLDESMQVRAMQKGIVNFYDEDVVNPFVALAARGPWIITAKGAVIHDNGGYGMLGFGHSPEPVLQAMNQHQVMANVMTASFSQYRLIEALKHEVGHSSGCCPYEGFLFVNSGSESVSVAARISDIHAALCTENGGPNANKTIKHIALKGGFHGRTDRPAQYSDSSQSVYKKHLASFRGRDNLLTVEPNNQQQLRQVFEQARVDGVFIESMFIEPVMGEGNPGLAIERDFYDLARELTSQHGALLLVDSIQAGLRAHGCLSIVDYPGFEGIQAPDMETWSKALNAGQYPLSVLAMNKRAAALYTKGVYGNTMTTNPRALDVATQVLSMITPDVRENIKLKGREFVTHLQQLSQDMNGLITDVQGTGLLVSFKLHSSLKCFGKDSIEERMRKMGVGVIHGGKNALRFTPHFNITSEEIDQIIKVIRQVLSTSSNVSHSEAEAAA